jgi:hypothetical protein
MRTNNYQFKKWMLGMLCVVGVSIQLEAQVAPYALSPQWRFGQQSGLSFPSGSFPTSGGPSAVPTASNAGTQFVETSTSVSDTTGAVALYSNTMNIYNISNADIRNLSSDNTCGGSAISGGVALPDPANPNTSYYLFVANDISGGGCQYRGSNYYRLRKVAGVVQYQSGPHSLIGNTVDESLCSGTDGQGGYWILTHSQNSNTFKTWKIDASGVNAVSDVSIGSSSWGGAANIKVSPCQDKVAWFGSDGLAVYNFNRTSGAIGSQIRFWSSAGHKYGLEFSSDGNILYTAGQGSVVTWYNIAANTSGTIAGSSSWTMQLGPDGKIYTSSNGGSSVGIINNPNSPTTTTYSTLAVNGSMFRGISNIGWLSPDAPVIRYAVACLTVDFSFLFKNYFKDNIAITPGSIEWDFGAGAGFQTGRGATPTHTYSASGSYTVRVRFRDATCSHQWMATQVVALSCVPTPVTLVRFDGQHAGTHNILSWATSSEIDNDYFAVQRSEDGINFYTIETLRGAGHSSSAIEYQYFDAIAESNAVYYYRLAQYDYDGTVSYSHVIAMKTSVSEPSVSPNPFVGSLRVAYLGSAEIEVFDILGRLVESKTKSEQEEAILVGASLAPGTYVVAVTTENDRYTYKVVKE